MSSGRTAQAELDLAATIRLASEGLTQAEIGERLGVTTHCVRMRLLRSAAAVEGLPAAVQRRSPGPTGRGPTGARLHRWGAHGCERCGCGTDPEVWPLAGQSCPGGGA